MYTTQPQFWNFRQTCFREDTAGLEGGSSGRGLPRKHEDLILISQNPGKEKARGWGDKTAQWVKVLAAKADHLSLVLVTHASRENGHLPVVPESHPQYCPQQQDEGYFTLMGNRHVRPSAQHSLSRGTVWVRNTQDGEVLSKLPPPRSRRQWTVGSSMERET